MSKDANATILKIKFKQTLTYSDYSKLGVDENRHQKVDKASCQTT